jgi:polyisoprenoid-binding protein YceI
MRQAAQLLTLVFGFLAVPATAQVTYKIDPAASSLELRVGKSGLFKFAGHEHVILAPRLGGRVVALAEDVSRSSVVLSIVASALAVSEKGEPTEDVPQVQAKMLGQALLDVTRFPTIEFRSKNVAGNAAGGGYDLTIQGELTLHGVTRSLSLALRVERSDEVLIASGRTILRQTDFDLTPISVAGVVKVKNEVEVDYRIVARAVPP